MKIGQGNIMSFLLSIYDEAYVETIGTDNFKVHLEFLIYSNFGYRASEKEIEHIQEQLQNNLKGKGVLQNGTKLFKEK